MKCAKLMSGEVYSYQVTTVGEFKQSALRQIWNDPQVQEEADHINVKLFFSGEELSDETRMVDEEMYDLLVDIVTIESYYLSEEEFQAEQL